MLYKVLYNVFDKLFTCLCQTTLQIRYFLVRKFTGTFYGKSYLSLPSACGQMELLRTEINNPEENGSH